jgi:hypothetical protein
MKKEIKYQTLKNTVIIYNNFWDFKGFYERSYWKEKVMIKISENGYIKKKKINQKNLRE